MKNISFIRKLKHIQKQYQRDKSVDGLLNSLHEMGLDLRYNHMGKYFPRELAHILILTGGDTRQRRFSKLCRRLGTAAKKQGKLVFINDIRTFVLTPVQFFDARKIPFHFKFREYKVTMRFIEQVEQVVWAESEEAAKEASYYKNCFKHKEGITVDAKCAEIIK